MRERGYVVVQPDEPFQGTPRVVFVLVELETQHHGGVDVDDLDVGELLQVLHDAQVPHVLQDHFLPDVLQQVLVEELPRGQRVVAPLLLDLAQVTRRGQGTVVDVVFREGHYSETILLLAVGDEHTFT